VVVLQREEGDSSHRIFDAALPGFAEINEAAYDAGRWRVLHHDGGMRDALINTPGAVGLFGQGAIPPRASFRALTIDGVAPTVENVESGRYPFHKTLSFVTRGEPTGLTAALLEFVASSEGRALIREAGYVPVGEEG
jgi:phosphate transport system substrate-binding protein